MQCMLGYSTWRSDQGAKFASQAAAWHPSTRKTCCRGPQRAGIVKTLLYRTRCRRLQCPVDQTSTSDTHWRYVCTNVSDRRQTDRQTTLLYCTALAHFTWVLSHWPWGLLRLHHRQALHVFINSDNLFKNTSGIWHILRYYYNLNIV